MPRHVGDSAMSILGLFQRRAGGGQRRAAAELNGLLAAIDRAQAVIEFGLDGKILHANQNFLTVMDYTLAEIIGQHHRMFVDAAERESSGYREFWERLGRGQVDAGQYKRIGKGGKEIWIQATYNPIFDAEGRPFKVVKFATDITAEKLSAADHEGQLKAVSKAQAIIEFALDGTVLQANENFLNTLGYTLEEIRGKHHRMFVEPSQRDSADYHALWERLRRGELDVGQYKRIAKNGREVWIQASYNPIFDMNGRPFKVVKYATDITTVKMRAADHAGQLRAVSKAQAVIEFALDGTVLEANENFLGTMGYSIEEIRGKHHRMFVEPGYRESAEYRAFWERLARGEFDAGQYKRIGKGGREIWIQASYNPIFDLNGRAYKVVKYATDITSQVGFMNLLEQSVAGIANAATQGDLTQRLPISGKNRTLDTLAGSINSLLDSMSQLIVRVQSAADEVSRGAEEISQGNTNLSQRTEEQASSLEETASSMEEMTSTVRQNADNAGQASQLAAAARSQAEKGGNVVARAVQAMAGINDASKKITDIIGVIDEIAFQTNLLALNAAVEAARAGEQGRGFAVVASEVRSLAGRSASAAKEIKALIKDSVQKVNEGSNLVTQSGATLEQLVGAVKKVNDIVAEIADASQEQSAGIEQVNKAVMQLDELTQQNAALVEEASASSQSMADQARRLNEMLAVYRMARPEGKLTSQPARHSPAAVPAVKARARAAG